MKRQAIVAIVALLAGGCWHATSMEEGNSPAGDYTYCGALTATCNAFYAGTPTACSQAARDQCRSFEPTYSEAFHAAVVSCARTFSPCIADFHDCTKRETARSTLSAIQTRVKHDFCAVCPDPKNVTSVGPCSTFFMTEVPDGGAPGMYGSGSSVLFVSDAVADEIDRTCVTPDNCGFGFAMCAARIRQEWTTPSACRGHI